MVLPHLVPAEYTCTVSAAILLISPAAICDLPPFLMQTNRTDGLLAVCSSRLSLAGGGDVEFVKQAADPLFDVVTDRTDRVD